MRLWQNPGDNRGLSSQQIRIICCPSRFCCLLLSDELMTAGDGGSNLLISDLRLPLKGFQTGLEGVSNGTHGVGGG